MQVMMDNDFMIRYKRTLYAAVIPVWLHVRCYLSIGFLWQAIIIQAFECNC